MRAAARHLTLLLALTAAAGASRAEEAGFGGAPVDEAPLEPPADSSSECLVQDERGAWIPCDLVLSAPEPPAPRAPELPLERRPEAVPEEPAAPAPEPRTERLGPAQRALAEVRRDKKPFPLVELRGRVAAVASELEAIRSDPKRVKEREPKERELAFLDGVLRHVEKEAFERMRRCLSRRRMPLPEPFKDYRMTPAGKVPLTREEIAAQGPTVDKYPCERVRVTDAETIAKITRLHEVERLLDEGDFGWARRDEKAALDKERRALVDEIDGDDPLRHFRRK